MKRELLLAEFFSTPWALMPERLQAFSAVVTRWSAGGLPSAEAMTGVQADALARAARRDTATASRNSAAADRWV